MKGRTVFFETKTVIKMSFCAECIDIYYNSFLIINVTINYIVMKGGENDERKY